MKKTLTGDKIWMYSGRRDEIRLLLEKGVNIRDRTNRGDTAFDIAKANGNYFCKMILIETEKYKLIEILD